MMRYKISVIVTIPFAPTTHVFADIVTVSANVPGASVVLRAAVFAVQPLAVYARAPTLHFDDLVVILGGDHLVHHIRTAYGGEFRLE